MRLKETKENKVRKVHPRGGGRKPLPEGYEQRQFVVSKDTLAAMKELTKLIAQLNASRPVGTKYIKGILVADAIAKGLRLKMEELRPKK